MTNFKRDYRYVTQQFFDKWNDRISKQITALDNRRVNEKVKVRKQLADLQAEIDAIKSLLLNK